MSREPESEPPLSPESFEALLREAAPAFAVDLPPSTIGILAGYLAELDGWRRRINLTGNLTGPELVDHCLESALGGDLIAHGEGVRVIDAGSGAGFPALPIAIARPDVSLQLVEPRSKKCAFLRHVARSLGLRNVTVDEARIEEVGGQTFDAVTTRALAGIEAWPLSALLKPGGLLLAWTTGAGALAQNLGSGFETVRLVDVPGSGRRQIAVFRQL